MYSIILYLFQGSITVTILLVCFYYIFFSGIPFCNYSSSLLLFGWSWFMRGMFLFQINIFFKFRVNSLMLLTSLRLFCITVQGFSSIYPLMIIALPNIAIAITVSLIFRLIFDMYNVYKIQSFRQSLNKRMIYYV